MLCIRLIRDHLDGMVALRTLLKSRLSNADAIKHAMVSIPVALLAAGYAWLCLLRRPALWYVRTTGYRNYIHAKLHKSTRSRPAVRSTGLCTGRSMRPDRLSIIFSQTFQKPGVTS